MEEERRITLDQKRCIGCRECVELCPQTRETQFPVFEMGEGAPRVANPASCLACLTCVEACRALALSVDGRREREGYVEPRARKKEEAIY